MLLYLVIPVIIKRVPVKKNYDALEIVLFIFFLNSVILEVYNDISKADSF